MKPGKMDCVLQCSYTASADQEAEVVSRVGLTYLAEGAAHIIYRISLPGTSAVTHPQLVGKLFRFRKSTPSAVPCAQTVSNYHNIIAPLFPGDNLVDLNLHHVPDQHALITKLNAALQRREIDRTRPVQRHGVYLTPSDEEPHDILVTDMSPRGPDERLIEFKPKWLVQSPSGPSGARRCRTCALREMRTEDERRTGDRHSGRGHAEFCPFDLLSSDDDVLEETVRQLALTNEFPRTYVSIFKQQLQPLLRRLKDLQAENNNVGLDDFEIGVDRDFSLSMALRDCSVFVKSKRGEVGFQEVRLADLDLKSSGGGKLERWAGMERRLIDEGWYMGIENAESQGLRFCRALQGS
jgi:inositol-pentakisphosphate 2-kinase